MAEMDNKPAEAPVEQPQKKPSDLRPLPFNITEATRQRFQQKFEKSTDKALNALMDAYENNSGSQSTILQLEEKIRAAEQSVRDNQKRIQELESQASSDKATIASLREEIKNASENAPEDMSEKVSELSEKLEASENDKKELSGKITTLEKSISEKDRMLKEMDKLTKGKINIKELQDKVGALEEQAKQDRKVIDGAAEQKKAYEKKVAELEKKIKELQDKNKELTEQYDPTYTGQYTAPEDFLGAFEPVVAMLLEATADKLTEQRSDGITVTPSLLLGDMFLKYTLQKRTQWFYWWVLTDDEIVEIAQRINPNINSVRMLRKVLNVDKELN